ncbi:MAG: TrkA family potassium uptake protein [Acidobacteriota bacterium]|jgi:trk system potassium uptake protein TrkA|nr:TrkA family potassium uptake protein [Acidobacteriota bacterium]
MYIVIGGAGVVGGGIAQIMRETHDVVVVDIDEARCAQIYAELGVLTVHGSATDLGVLQQAGIDRADAALALMRNDADNITFTLLARQFGVTQCVVRMRDSRYRDAYDLAGATYIISELDLYLHELVLAVERPRARRIAEIGGGEAEMLAVQVPEGAAAAGLTVREIAQRPSFPQSGVIAGILDKERKLTIPRGDAVVPGDSEVLVVVKAEDVADVVDCLTMESRGGRKT